MTQVSIETQKKNAFIKLKKEVLKWQDKCGLMGHNVVLKSVGGHGGSEVFLVSMEEWDEEEKTQEKLQPLLNRKLLCQEWIDSDSRDIRIYVIGGQPYAAVLRQGFGDFRSNYSLGGSVREYSLDNMTKELVRQYIMALGGSALAFVGVDFLLEKSGCMVFNELEEMVGCRPIVRYTTSVTDPEISSQISKMTQTIVFSYSNLNNTKVSLPDSLKKVMEAKS